MATEKFNIRWNNYTTVLHNYNRKLLDDEKFVDVTLACEGKSIKCHKVVLSACSTYFEKVFTENSQHNHHLVIYLKDMKQWELQALVTFMYNGEVSVDQNKLPGLVKAAESLKIKGLARDVAENNDDDDAEGYPMMNKNKLNNHDDYNNLLLRHMPQSSKQQQLKRKNNNGPPNLVKMPRIERQQNGSITSPLRVVKSELGQSTDDDNDEQQQQQQQQDQDQQEENNPDQHKEDFEINEEDVDDNLEMLDDGNIEEDVHSESEEIEDISTFEAAPMAGPRRSYPYKYGKEIRDSVCAALGSGMSLRQCSEAFGIPRKTLSKWKQNEILANNMAMAEEAGEIDEESLIANVPIRRGPVQDPADRADRLQRAMELAVSGITVRQAAAHFDIPRTTLCAFMKRKGIAPKRNFLNSGGTPPNRRKVNNSLENAAAAAIARNTQNAQQFEDFPFLGVSDMIMDEMNQGS